MASSVQERGRIGQICDACGQVDDHPRVHRTLPDGRSETLHHDCAAALGEPFCQHVVRHSGGKQGEELRKHLQSAEFLSDETTQSHSEIGD